MYFQKYQVSSNNRLKPLSSHYHIASDYCVSTPDIASPLCSAGLCTPTTGWQTDQRNNRHWQEEFRAHG